MKHVAVYTGTRNVYGDMIVAAKSLIYHKGAEKVVFLTEDDTFPELLPDIVQNINVSNQRYFTKDCPNIKRWTYMVLMKVAACIMTLDASRLLVLDIDTIVDGDLSGLWSLPDAPIYMAKEIGRSGDYYNAGVMLVTPWLFADYAKTIIHRLNIRDYQFCEQDAINEVCQFRINQLPSIYNASNWTVDPDGKPVITHYAAKRNWHSEPLWLKYAGMKWDEVMQAYDSPPGQT